MSRAATPRRASAGNGWYARAAGPAGACGVRCHGVQDGQERAKVTVGSIALRSARLLIPSLA
jgi:hypothetical protein